MYFFKSGVLTGFLLFTLVAYPQEENKSDSVEVKTVLSVDLNKYAGLWYEIAKIPNSYQRNCVSGITATYKLRDDGDIDVINHCIEEDGEIDEAEGLAQITDTVSNAKLKVSFVSILGFHFFWGDYWIIGLSVNYDFAVVGHPTRRYGWILSRTPKLSEEKLGAAFQILKDNGYNPKDFTMTIQ